VAGQGSSTLVNNNTVFAITTVELLASASALARARRRADSIIVAVAGLGYAVVDGSAGLAVTREAGHAEACAIARGSVSAGGIIAAVAIVALAGVDFHAVHDIVLMDSDIALVAVARERGPAAVSGNLAHPCRIADRVYRALSKDFSLARSGRRDLAGRDRLAGLAVTREATVASDRSLVGADHRALGVQ